MGDRKRGRGFLALEPSSLATAPADVHALTQALAKLLAPAEAKPKHIPQETGLSKG